MHCSLISNYLFFMYLSVCVINIQILVITMVDDKVSDQDIVVSRVKSHCNIMSSLGLGGTVYIVAYQAHPVLRFIHVSVIGLCSCS